MIKRVVVGATIAAAGVAAYASVRRWWETWGVDPAESARALPGDDLVEQPTTSDTRVLTIDAPPEAVWPWLVQMGYGRAGWYSYDRLDMRGTSAEEIVPEWQNLSVGDTLPTHPGGGFEVRVLEPGHALVAYVDSAMAARWKEGRDAGETQPTGLAVSGGFLDTSMPREFAATWTFVVEREAGGRTRLIERVRARFDGPTAGSRLMGPALGFGVFFMTQRHMLGVRKRAEAHARRGVMADEPSIPEPVG